MPTCQTWSRSTGYVLSPFNSVSWSFACSRNNSRNKLDYTQVLENLKQKVRRWPVARVVLRRNGSPMRSSCSFLFILKRKRGMSGDRHSCREPEAGHGGGTGVLQGRHSGGRHLPHGRHLQEGNQTATDRRRQGMTQVNSRTHVLRVLKRTKVHPQRTAAQETPARTGRYPR